MSGSEQPDEYDSPWKEALERYLEPFMALLFPEIHGNIDWSCAALIKDEKEQSMPYVTSMERRGKRQGRKRGKRLAIAQALAVRFRAVPARVAKSLSKVSNLAVLNELLRQAILAESLEAFEWAMRERVAR
jgi:hypothetical protein